MRVLIVSGTLPPIKCGIGDYTAHLADALSDHATVGVLTSSAVQPVSRDYRFEVLPAVSDWNIRNWLLIWRTLKAWKPDLVHTQYPTQAYGNRILPMWLPTLAALAGPKVVQTWHEYVKQNTLGWLRFSLLYLPSAVVPGGLVAVRPNYLETMSGWYRKIASNKMFRYIPNAPTIPTVILTEAERRKIQRRFVGDSSRKTIVFFGFALPSKGIEQLFEITDPNQHHLVLVCDLESSDRYQKQLLDRASTPEWSGNVTITGFLSAAEVSDILAAADAIVFPFREGGGSWNTSLQAALAFGGFVLSTSTEPSGYVPGRNLYLAKPGDLMSMRQAIARYAGQRVPVTKEMLGIGWPEIARAHIELYADVLK